MTEAEAGLTAGSMAFSHGGNIPVKYTCEGDNINPPLEIGGIPGGGTRSLAVIMEDHDAPRGYFRSLAGMEYSAQ